MHSHRKLARLAPARESGRCLSYCPRCWGQYVVASGGCAACGLALAAFATSE